MAEGGGEEDLDNPFSFKSYVKKKTKQQDDQDIDTDDIFSITSSASSSRKKEKQSLVVADDDDDAAHTSKAKKKSKENPFSFKKFLGQSTQKEGDSSQRRNPPADLVRNESAPAGMSASSLGPSSASVLLGQGHSLGQHAAAPPDFASDLPDFIQNHYGEDQGKRQLPDFTIGSRGVPQDRGEQEGAASLFGAHRDSLADTTFSDDDDDGDGAQRSQPLSLPDFLVDSTKPGAQKGKGGSEDSKNSASARTQGEPARSRLPELPPLGDSVNGVHIRSGSDAGASESAIILQLREENRQLQDRISQMQQRARDEEVRVAGLEKEISRLQKKEAEETAVMERAVQQVEENLVATTTRAVKAETMVTKLKQEVKTLQGQVKVLKAENETLQSGDKGLSDIRERTKYASEQLVAAAVTAEANLRDLMGGVEKLKLLGQVLSSLEKVTDADSSPTQDSPGNSPT